MFKSITKLDNYAISNVRSVDLFEMVPFEKDNTLFAKVTGKAQFLYCSTQTIELNKIYILHNTMMSNNMKLYLNNCKNEWFHVIVEYNQFHFETRQFIFDLIKSGMSPYDAFMLVNL